jgi:hypothetical protein
MSRSRHLSHQTPSAQGHSPAGAVPGGPGAAFEHLEVVLRHLLAEHERLLALAGEHKAAIAAADGRALGLCIGRQNEIVQRIAGLERERQTIVAAIVRPGSSKPGMAGHDATLTKVTAAAPEPVRSRLAGAGVALRDILNRLHKEHQAVKAASETLSAHMEGLMRQVCQRLSHAGTYARGGSVGASVQVVSAMDVRS